MFEKSDNETLVDGKLLSYAYLEAGVVEFAAGYVDIPFDMRTNSYLICCRIVSYFIVFGSHGFSPSDLQRAQKAGGERLNEY